MENDATIRNRWKSVEKEEVEFSLLAGDISILSQEVLLLDSEDSNFKLEDSKHAHYPLLGIFFMSIAWLAFSGSFVIIKLTYNMNENITFIDHAISKSILPIFIYYYVAKTQNVNLFKMSRKIMMLLFARVLFGVSAMALITFSINYISVSVNTVIINLSPIYVTFLAFLILKEKITKIEVGLMLLGFFGIYLISLDKPSDTLKKSNYILGISLNVLASIFMAFGYIALRKINTTESPLFSPFYFFIGAMVFSVITMVVSPSYIPKVHTYTFFQIMLFVWGQWTALVSQTFMSMAYKYEKASRLAPFTYLQVVFAIIADLIIFHTVFTWLQVLGMTLISAWLLTPAFMKYYGYLS